MNAPWLNVTLPAHNEEAQLATSVRRVAAFLDAQGWNWELVIANNGSQDRTGEIAEWLAAESGSRLGRMVRVCHQAASGRGAALREAWMTSHADIVSYMDVDLSTDLACLRPLVEPLGRGEVDLAIGSRLLPGSRTTRSWKREGLSRGYNWLLRWALGFNVHDAQCGFKAITRAAAGVLLPQVKDDGWFFDTELLWRAQCGGWRVREVPVNWVDDPGTTVRLLPTVWCDLAGIRRLRREAPRACMRRVQPGRKFYGGQTTAKPGAPGGGPMRNHNN